MTRLWLEQGRDRCVHLKRTELSIEQGYNENLEDVVQEAKFEEEYMQMVTVRDIEYHSLCEHHLLPFYGKVTTCSNLG